MSNAGAKSSFRRATLACLLGLSACAGQPPPAAPPPPPGGSLFNATLSPFGSWDEVRGIGPVWRPSPAVVGRDFVPYVTHGHWLWSRDGWVFLSDYPWGWATFHYGRWSYSSTYGWQWAPDTTWGPAWVDWRYGGGYVSWSPTQPPQFGGRQRWHLVEARHFTARDLMPRSVSETPAILAALERPAPASDQPTEVAPSPFPPKEWIAAAIGRAVPEPSFFEKKREDKARHAFGAPKPPAVAAAAPSPRAPAEEGAATVVADASALRPEAAQRDDDDRPRKKRTATSKRTKKSKHRRSRGGR